eukprot:831430-Lingulodinium_polyedra.AAC.1
MRQSHIHLCACQVVAFVSFDRCPVRRISARIVIGKQLAAWLARERYSHQPLLYRARLVVALEEDDGG